MRMPILRFVMTAAAIGMALVLAACARHVRPLDDQTAKTIQTARVVIVGGKMNDMSAIAKRSGPLRAPTAAEVEATRAGLQGGIDAADVVGLLRSNAMKNASLAAPIVLDFDGRASGNSSPFEGHQLRIEYTAGVRSPGGIVLWINSSML